MKQISLKLILVVAIVFLVITGAMTPQKSNLIPRKVLFGDPEKIEVRLSPNGKYLSYLAPGGTPNTKKFLNIWIKSIKQNDDKQITFDENRSIRRYFWAFDDTKILYLQDKKGDENWLLYQVDINTKKQQCLTPLVDTQVRIIEYNKKHPESLLISLNKDDKKLHDVYLLNLSTGQLKLAEKNPGEISDWLADEDLNVRAAVSNLSDGSTELLIKKNGDFNPIIRWNYEDALLSEPIKFCNNGQSIYLYDSRNSDTRKLVRLNLADESLEEIIKDPTYDIESIQVNSDTYELEAASFLKEFKEWVVIDKNMQNLFDKFLNVDNGNLHIINTDKKRKKWLLCFEKDKKSAVYYLYNTKLDEPKFLFAARPKLNGYSLCSMKPISFKSRDNLTIHGYLTKPKDKIGRLPLVLFVHGGPWTRDVWGYEGIVQWLANRGYAVLQVNYRGSTGYGKSFVRAGDKEWGGKMHNDLVDAVQWAIESEIADPKKIAIFGGSYGGYAALVGAAFTPDIFCCAVDIVGVSNLLTLLNSIPPYWHVVKNHFYKSIGNPETEAEFLKERSPLFKANNIKIPLLIAHGANDPRVKQAESEQIVAALKEHNIPYQYMLFEDEGHGFANAKNKLKFFAAAEKFLACHLGGLCQE